MTRTIVLLVGCLVVLASFFVTMTFWVGARSLDPVFWPYTGMTRATYGVEAPAKVASLGRDCFIHDGQENILPDVTREYLNDYLVACSTKQHIVDSHSDSNFVKVVARCNLDGRVLERSVLVLRGASFPPDICTVSLFDQDSDLGVGRMTISSYESADSE